MSNFNKKNEKHITLGLKDQRNNQESIYHINNMRFFLPFINYCTVSSVLMS